LVFPIAQEAATTARWFWWRWQRARRGATRQGRRRGKAKAGAGRKAKEWQKGGREGVCVEKAAAATVVSWGRWWRAHWERRRRRRRRGVGGEARYVFRRLNVDGDGGGEGGKAEEAK
jgi:hypothetical protein